MTDPSSLSQLPETPEKIVLTLPPKTPVLACIGTVQVGHDAHGHAVWKKDNTLFTCPSDQGGQAVAFPVEEKDVVRWLDEPWPYPFKD